MKDFRAVNDAGARTDVGQLLRIVLPAVAGLVFAKVAGVGEIEESSSYGYLTALLLAIGLYGSTFAIDLTEARKHLRTIGLAVTVGVVLKAALIGAVLTLAWWNPLFLILGVAVAQIDPLAVASIMDHPRMSQRAKSILAAWSSFDDPVTVILAVYATALVAGITDVTPINGNETGWLSYLGELGGNLLFAGVAYAAWRLLRRWPLAVYALLAVLFAVAVWQFTMLGLAIAGLFVRPPIGAVLNKAVQGALVAAAFLLGMLLLGGVSVLGGLSLGLAAFGAQILVGYLLTRGLPAIDRTHIAFAQQNGITAIILALLLERSFDNVVAVVAPSILVINVTYVAVNYAIDRRARQPVDT